MKRATLFFIFLAALVALAAQQGSPLLTHYTESRDIENQNWAICQDENGVMFFANRKGVLTFDGEEWSLIRLSTVPYSMKRNPGDGKLYIGGNNNFGYLEKDLDGSYNYISLSGELIDIGVITRIVFSDSIAWFYGEKALIRFNLSEEEFEMILYSKPDYPFNGFVVTPENAFVNVFRKGLHRIDSDTLFPIVTGYMTANEDILFSLEYDRNNVLLGMGSGKLSLFDGIKHYDYNIKDDNYLEENILSEGIVLGDTAYAFSTLEGGAIVVNKLSGRVIFRINSQSELPDDEVFAIGFDKSGGLWLSHQYGLTRADLNLPASNYGIFPGLQGNLSNVLTYNNELYVATSKGVYYLSEVKNYTEVEVLIKKEQPIPKIDTKIIAKTRKDAQQERRSIFSRILGRQRDDDEAEKTPAITEEKPEVQYALKTISQLKSIDYIYKNVEGLSEKCRQLVSTPYGILAATNKGLYSIKDHKAFLITQNRYINFISWLPVGNRYWIGCDNGYFAVSYLNGKWITEMPDQEFYHPVYSIFQKDSRTLWLGIDNAAYKANLQDNSNNVTYIPYSLPNDFPERYMLDLINDTIFIFSEADINYYNASSDRFETFSQGSSENLEVISPLSNHRFFKHGREWKSFNTEQTVDDKELSLLKIFDDVVSITVEPENLWIIDGKNKLYGIDRKRYMGMNPSVNVFIKSISSGKGMKFALNEVNLERGDNTINFNIIAPGYLKQNTTQYQYIINKVMDDWSPWSERTTYDRTISKPGEYTLQVRARDLWGNISEPNSVKFTIKPPLTKTLGFYVLSGLLLLSLVVFIIKYRERQFVMKNKLLEDKVRERTFEIESQKQEITSSIEYAGRIQMAMLPEEDHFKEAFSDYFIIFKPRDIVSGDFYWIGEDSKSIFFTVADCTGHGVPGAFMSTMGMSTLNEIIANNGNLAANEVLNLLRKKTMTALHQKGKIGEAADGMDIAFCVLDKNRTKLQYSGAFNPLFLFQGGELKEYKADRMPIGIHYGKEIPFTNHVIKVARGDTLYIFSDGYTSQFGGPEGGKFKKQNLRKLLSEIYYRPMIEQQNILLNEFERWKGTADQVDDVAILGIRI
ncbi:MAG TPA: SpoIIE family protein phosphatase [Bacteroidales bacterium]|nr:SpoIIE family protein phosphatase [Bacteroidales bacterium]